MAKVSTLIVTGKKEQRQKMWEAIRLLRVTANVKLTPNAKAYLTP